MSALRFVAIAVTWLSALMPIVASASEPDAKPKTDVQKAWAILAKHGEKDTQKLTHAILDIVHAGVEEDLDRLVDYTQSTEFCQAFALPNDGIATARSCSLSRLMLGIAQCDTMFAEELLVRYAHSNSVFGKFIEADSERYDRSIAVVWAMGYLHPKTNGTYSLLAMGVMDRLHEASGHALVALARIGDERAAAVIRRNLIRRDPAELDALAYAGRDRPAIFGLLLRLAEETPDAKVQQVILQSLVLKQSVRRFIDQDPYAYPIYDTLPAATRDKIFQLAKSVDAKKLSVKSVELLNQLKGILSQRK